MSQTFCAICTSDINADTLRRAPLGKGGALVNVCDDCFDEPAYEQREYQRGYQIGPDENKGSMRKKINIAAARHSVPSAISVQHAQRISNIPMYRSVQPGFVICRVLRRSEVGRLRDQQAAYAIAKETWGPLVRMVGQTTLYFVYERPNPTDLAKPYPDKNPLEAIAKYQVDPGSRPPAPKLKVQKLNKWKSRLVAS